jgi:hypothetical protein
LSSTLRPVASASGAGVDDPDPFVAELHSGRVRVSGAVVGLAAQDVDELEDGPS